MSDNGTGMQSPPNSQASGAVNSQDTPKKKSSQGKFRSAVSDQRSAVKVDTNKHGIRRETNLNANNKRGRPKKV